MGKFFLGKPEKNIALILGRILGFLKEEPVPFFFNPGIMAGYDKVTVQLSHTVEKLAELKITVTVYARIGSPAAKIAGSKMIDDFFFKLILKIKDIKRHAKLIGHTSGIFNVVQGTAGTLGLLCFGVKKLHVAANGLCSGFNCKGGGNAGINASAHGDQSLHARSFQKTL
jgi:hypothetical protein